MNQVLIPATPPPGHRLRLAARSAAGLLLALLVLLALAAVAILLV